MSLLPEGGPAAAGYRAFLDRFQEAETIFVVVDLPSVATPSPDDLADAADAVAEALADAPEVAEARSAIEAGDETFLREAVLPRAPVLSAAGEVEAIAAKLTPAAVQESVERLRETAGFPLGSAAAPWIAADPLGLSGSLLSDLQATSGAGVDPLTGAFLSRDGRAALVLVRPARADLDPSTGRALQRAIAVAADRARRESGFPLMVAAVGGPLYAAHDEAAFRRDLLRTLAVATVLVGALIVVAFDGMAIPLAALLAMAAAQVWTAAVLALGFGRVTAVGVGLAAILVGLGDDFVVHLAARFRDRISEGSTQAVALAEAMRETAPGIFSAALTTAAGFLVLALARFRPVAELGLFVSLGVLVVLLTTALVAAPCLVLGARRWRLGASRPVWRAFGAGLERVVLLAREHRRAVLAVAALSTALAVLGLVRLRLDTDLRRLRPADPSATRLETRLAEQFGLGLDTATVVVPAPTMNRALEEAAAVSRTLRAELPAAARVVSPSDLLPGTSEVQQRLHALASLPWARASADLRSGLVSAGLDPDAFTGAFAALAALSRGQDPAPVAPGDPSDLPSWMRDAMRQGPADAAVAVQVQLPLHAWPEGPPDEIRVRVAHVSPGARWASAPWLGTEIRGLALSDLRRLGTIALIVAGAGILVSFRGRLRPSLLAAVPVVLGSLWTFGLWGALGVPLDLFALGVVPVLFCIGMDDGLHVLHAAGGGSVAEAVCRAGRGVLLTNLTTSVGFGSLLLSQVPGLRNGGLLICVGNLLCLLATFLVLPAMPAVAREGSPPRSAQRTER